MRRRLPLQAEVFRRLDQAGSEIALPEAIHGHAAGQRIGGIHEPAGQSQAIARRALRHRRQAGGHAGLDLLLLVGHVIAAALEHERVARPR